MRPLILIVAAGALVLGACERHTWEDVDQDGDGTIGINEKGTRHLYEKHEKGGHHSGEKGHAKEGEKAEEEHPEGEEKN